MTSLAARLWNARQSGAVIDPLDPDLPKHITDAYAIQHKIVALSGHKARGFKVGSTSVEAQRLLGTDEPGSGVLLEPCIFESPANVKIVVAHNPAVEGEFAFRMGHDLPARTAPYTLPEVAEAVEAVSGAIEVVGTRFSDGLAGKGRLLTTADGGVNIALVIGEWTTYTSSVDLKSHHVSMSINGTLRGSGPGARALGDPLHVLLWLANQQSVAGRGLKGGEIISTGTCTGLDPVQPRDRVQADFGALGTVFIDFG
jgi:2-keto-4-pentenoate hydratase